MKILSSFAVVVSILLMTACSMVKPDIVADNSAVEIRQIQTRHYDTLDRNMTMRSVIATLQDLGFIVDAADPDLGLVTGTRLDKYTMRMTVTVSQKTNEQVSVRANARINETGIRDAVTYQDFFVVLDKAMFLTLNRVD
jgi:hypothetical protein